LSIVLGLFLLVAAGLKGYGQVFDPFAADSLLGSSRTQLAAVEYTVTILALTSESIFEMGFSKEAIANPSVRRYRSVWREVLLCEMVCH
jgi:hypothetical protein